MKGDSAFSLDVGAGEVAWTCVRRRWGCSRRAVGGSRARDMLGSWADGLASRRDGVQSRGCQRFAFYGRVSTEDWQDPVTSRAAAGAQWEALVRGTGRLWRSSSTPGPTATG